MADFRDQRIAKKSLEELIESLGNLEAGEPGSPAFEMTKVAIQTRLAERLAQPRRFAAVATVAAVISAGAAVAATIAAF